jgi:hypothetical protein
MACLIGMNMKEQLEKAISKIRLPEKHYFVVHNERANRSPVMDDHGKTTDYVCMTDYIVTVFKER